ncbi:sodium-dependent neutral amino acid transporter B(0)AT2-like isoform X1 [Alosa sapidissima]|uniref:sodium-dependent neutral amino acid transporter B(0)AT2-like isoform X1 n=1 Tax=Alosa sapidissima TaxID=34773 RepID=UPI001C093944|nr:sodium-dependent neutral amino acid transporter B(0)AT2-like isoform X1 [Alosa sapidissima]XP_041939309.1 sodium-dependent neutral amino acid transporter B(0)AT2-like isoform X1 [Alosa sapidissima]XP_041939310.1 sodium-dependent neutral amino acid transporter B(0)AT2-like isoform X1 [Alosa sapidissima]XP_041939313.1 sodium-dependent neutral amino acid transporter B(0)AT2-like isoform X1 [Alosa sapidissima]
MEKAPLPGDERDTGEAQQRAVVDVAGVDGTEAVVARDGWDSKLEYVLAQVGFSVGLGNVWRFPYLCHQNGGGAFLLLYILLMLVVGVPLFFLELAAGQSIRQGSIGVWKCISPKLAGIGYSSCLVCFFVALYYNVIIGWSLFYLGNSFQNPLPWQNCPEGANGTVVKECAASSPTAYFWFRKALDITDSINEIGQFNSIMTGCLLAAWAIVCLGMFKGIKSSGKVMYFSSVFPYVVLLCFLIRGLLLDGAVDGLKYLLYPELSIWKDVQVWRQAATQVFFALGLGFGSVIAYSSYNPRHNNCHRDAIMVASVNFMTSVLASLVVFSVLGFRAKKITLSCVTQNLELLKFETGQHINITEPDAYNEWLQVAGPSLPINLTNCTMEREMNKGVEGTGLAFIAFTEAMTLFPGSPFWSALFFLMLLNLGLSTMFGTMEGILTPLYDNFASLAKRKTAFTVFSCTLGFLIGLLFTQRCGNYFVMMFDDYSATLPLIIVVVFETISVAWVYGADRFLDDIEKMLLWRPPRIYKYLWKYVCLFAMVGLLSASLVRMVLQRPTYKAYSQDLASEETLEYPDWALAVLSILIVCATLPVPVCFLYHTLREHFGQPAGGGGTSHSVVNGHYRPCSTTDPDATPVDARLMSEAGTPLTLAEDSQGLLFESEGVAESTGL